MKTRLSWVLSGMLCLLALGVQASSVYDDCVWFFNGGTDGFGGKAVDQVVQQGEIADELHRGTASHANHQALPQGLAMSFTREKVPLHAQGVGTQEVSCAKLNHTYSVVPGEGGTATTNFGFSTLKMPFLGDYCTNGNYSAIFRIRRDAANPFKETSWFMNFGYAGDNGFLLGFDNAGKWMLHANNRKATTGDLPSTAVPVGRWVELGVVVNGNAIWLYEAFPGSNTPNSWSDYTSCKISTYTAWKDTAKTIPKDYTMHSSYIFMGGQESKSETSLVRDPAYGNTIKFAPITIQRVAFWNRSLTPSEVAEAFAFPRPGLFTLGAANGSADEFTAAAAATKTINAARVEEPMQDVPKQLCAGDVWTVNFMAKADDALNQLLVFTATPSSPAATLAVTLNGATITSAATLPAGGKCVVPIRAKYFTQGTKGSKTRLANVLTIRRTDAGQPVGVDAVWLGGSWNVGEHDGNGGGSFAWNGSDTQFFNQLEGFQFQRARNFGSGVSASNLYIRVRTPKEVTDRYGKMTFTGRTNVDKLLDGHILRLLENNQVLTTIVAPKAPTWGDFSCEIGAGEHTLNMNFIVPDKGPCYWFDCYTLTFDIPPAGTLLLVR